jgi:uncharacterized membrane protein YhiD involved in acid resistance
MSIFIFSSRFALALVLGALIGLERQWRAAVSEGASSRTALKEGK